MFFRILKKDLKRKIKEKRLIKTGKRGGQNEKEITFYI